MKGDFTRGQKKTGGGEYERRKAKGEEPKRLRLRRRYQPRLFFSFWFHYRLAQSTVMNPDFGTSLESDRGNGKKKKG